MIICFIYLSLPIKNCFTWVGTCSGSKFGDDYPLSRFVLFISIRFQKSTLVRYRSVFKRKPYKKKMHFLIIILHNYNHSKQLNDILIIYYTCM